MNCDKYNELIHQSLDGELNSSEQGVLDAHLESCEDCTMKYEELKMLKEVLDEESLLELPEGFKAELHDKLMKEDQPEKPSFFKRRAVQNTAIGLVAAALAITVVLPSALNGMPSYQTEDAIEYGESRAGTDKNAVAMDASPAPTITFNESMEMENANFTVTATGMAVEEAAEEPAAPMMESVTKDSLRDESSETDHLNVNERKVIKNGEIVLDITDYDAVFQSIVTMTETVGGYVHSSNEQLQYYNRHSEDDPLKYGFIRVRVPSDMFSSFMEQIKEHGVVTYSGSNAQDVSYQYRNAVSEVQNLEVTERSLRDLMAKAEDIDDIIYIERELMRVRSEINMYMGSIKQWDDLASMSILSITLNEVEILDGEVKPIDDSLWAKAKNALINNLNGLTRFAEGIVIWFVATLPLLIVLGVSIFIIYKLLKWIIRKLFN